MAILTLPVDQRIIDIDSQRFASVEKALVELVTNSDDSYSRLEQALPSPGTITIRYERHDRGAVISVTDAAEGMTLDRLRTVLTYGGAHSQLASGGTTGRGFFGRGLKQAVFGLGHGWVESIRDGRLARVDLFRDESGSYVYDDQDGDRAAASGDYAALGLEPGGHGTRVTIVVDNPQVTLPLYRSLVTALSGNFYLRDILARRRLTLINGNLPRRRVVPTPLRYEEPPSELLLGPGLVGSFDFDGRRHDFELTLRKASADLILRGDERDSGLLVVSGTAVLDCQFFRFEGQLGTEYLFGTVSCPDLVAALASGRPVISDEREGLNQKDPFVAAFAAAVSEVIEPVVESERLRLSHVDHASTSRRTEALLQQVLGRMNRVAVEDLGIVLPPGPGTGSYGPFPTGRPALLRFTTPFYFRPVGRDFRVTLVVDRPRLLDETLLHVEPDLPASVTIVPDEPRVRVGDLPADGRLSWTLRGSEAGAKGRLRVTAGPAAASCEIVIAADAARHAGHHERSGPPRPHVPWDQDNATDLFAGFELRNLDNDIDRAVYSPAERLIIVNTEAPTVRLYVDGQGHFRDSARLLLAELFLDVIAGELAHRYVDRTLQKGDAEAYEQAKHTFIRRYGLEIHRILMGQ
nr:ATP-binding protein [Propionibacterium sp.]